MSVITISRQMGSLGRQVAEELGRCLKYRVVMREVINEAARRAGAPEVALATIDELDLLGLRPPEEDRKAYDRAVREILKEMADEGNVVIVGRAGQILLADQPDTLHVRIYAPFDLRVERIAAQYQLALDAAQARVEISDQSRARYLRRYTQTRWDDPILYDLMINTAKIDPPAAAEMICAVLKHPPLN